MTSLVIKTLDDLDNASNDFISVLKQNKIVAFKGEMGVGKTTFIKSLCKHLNVIDEVNSPTFAIVNEYFSVDYGKIFHFDFYRIKDKFEILDIGFEEYINQDAIIFMEWPELIENFLPEDTIEVVITQDEQGIRYINWS